MTRSGKVSVSPRKTGMILPVLPAETPYTPKGLSCWLDFSAVPESGSEDLIPQRFGCFGTVVKMSLWIRSVLNCAFYRFVYRRSLTSLPVNFAGYSAF